MACGWDAQAKARLRHAITKMVAIGTTPVSIVQEVFGAEDGRCPGARPRSLLRPLVARQTGEGGRMSAYRYQ
jgi:hypothetical protein